MPRNQTKASVPPRAANEVNFLAFHFLGKRPMPGCGDRAAFRVLRLGRDFFLHDHE